MPEPPPRVAGTTARGGHDGPCRTPRHAERTQGNHQVVPTTRHPPTIQMGKESSPVPGTHAYLEGADTAARIAGHRPHSHRHTLKYMPSRGLRRKGGRTLTPAVNTCRGNAGVGASLLWPHRLVVSEQRLCTYGRTARRTSRAADMGFLPMYIEPVCMSRESRVRR